MELYGTRQGSEDDGNSPMHQEPLSRGTSRQESRHLRHCDLTAVGSRTTKSWGARRTNKRGVPRPALQVRSVLRQRPPCFRAEKLRTGVLALKG